MDCNAPEQVAITYLAQVGHWNLPKLWSAISTSPATRWDRAPTPGYDADTQSWYDPGGVEFPKIPNAPDIEAARDALACSCWAFSTFPFESETDRAVALALALALVRRSLWHRWARSPRL